MVGTEVTENKTPPKISAFTVTLWVIKFDVFEGPASYYTRCVSGGTSAHVCYTEV